MTDCVPLELITYILEYQQFSHHSRVCKAFQEAESLLIEKRLIAITMENDNPYGALDHRDWDSVRFLILHRNHPLLSDKNIDHQYLMDLGIQSIHANNIHMVSFILHQGLDDYYILASEAASQCKLEILKMIVENYPISNYTDIAQDAKSIECMEYLISKGADILSLCRWYVIDKNIVGIGYMYNTYHSIFMAYIKHTAMYSLNAQELLSNLPSHILIEVIASVHRR